MPSSEWVIGVLSRSWQFAVLSWLEQGLQSPMAWSMKKVVFVGGVYVLDPSCASPTCGQSL